MSGAPAWFANQGKSLLGSMPPYRSVCQTKTLNGLHPDVPVGTATKQLKTFGSPIKSAASALQALEPYGPFGALIGS
jgi:hypothetical protein